MNLLNESLWRDEAFAALLSRHEPSEIIGLSAGDATPPLFYLVLHFWVGVLGDSEVAMRALTLLFFVATGFVMFLLGSRLGGTARGLARQPVFPLAAFLFLTPIVGALAVSQIKPVFLDRYLIVVVPAELLLLVLPAATTRHFRYLAAVVLLAHLGASAYLFTHPA